MFALAWFFFVKGQRKGWEQSLVAIILMVPIHYYFFSNVMTALDL